MTHALIRALVLGSVLLGSAVHAQAQEAPRNVAIVLFEGVELLDFAGPGEVFAATHVDHRPAFNTYTVATTTDAIVSQGFVNITPEFSIENCPPPDIVVFPGGNVPLVDEALREWVANVSTSAETMMSVCNGALVYAAVGLLDGLEVTTHRSALQGVMFTAPDATVFTNRRFVDSGHVLTSAGVSAGIDGALALVTRLHGAEVAGRTAHYMEYAWRPDEIAELHAQPGTPPAGGEIVEVLRLLPELGVKGVAKKLRALDDATSESTLNRVGYAKLTTGHEKAAYEIFALVCEVFPGSANAHDSLAEALEALGREEEALAATMRSLELLKQDDPRREQLENACRSRIARLEGEADPLPFACAPCGMDCDSRRFAERTACPACGGPMVRVDG